MKEFKVENHEPSILPDGEWKLVWADEFDGESLDKTKWNFRHHIFHKEHPCWIEDEGLSFENSNIHFKLVEKDGKFYSCQLQTGENWMDRPSDVERWPIAELKTPKFEHKFGYYECRCKLQKGDNWWSAFWLQSPTIGCHIDEKKAGVEVDIMESFIGGHYSPHYIHYGGYGKNHQFATTYHEHAYSGIKGMKKLKEGWHVFGLLWEEDGYTFFIDGVQNGRKITEVVSHADTFVLIGTEPNGYRGYIPGHVKDNPHYKIVENDEFIVDYVRVFDKMK
jgi:beta-glucanase (GH16 family)